MRQAKKRAGSPERCKVTNRKGEQCRNELGPGSANGACAMHYQRKRRTGKYGDVEAEIAQDGDAKKPIKVYVTDELRNRVDDCAGRLGTTRSEWSELVLDKESKKATRRAQERQANEGKATR